MFPHTFSSLRVGAIEVKNRLFMAPMGSNYADEHGQVTDQLIHYYNARAVGGIGMITVEGAYPAMGGRVLARQLSLDKDDVIEGLGRLAENIHKEEAKAAIQILHAGRQTREAVCGQKPVAPSPIPCPVCQETPHELTHPEIEEIIESHAQAALRARKAGFDAVELHCAHGYLLNQFLSPYSNHRTDAYGGSTENRTRMVVRIIEQIRNITDSGLVLGCRMSADEFVPHGLDLDESIRIAEILEAAGLDYLSISGGVYESIQRVIPPIYIPPGSLVHLAHGIKKAVNIPVATVGGFTDPEMIEQVLRDQKADMVILGRALLADPDFAVKAEQGQLQNIIPCVNCNNCRRRDLRPQINCMMNYQTGRENETKLRPSPIRKKVLVVGGGPAGMEAARVARIRGHQVTLIEKTDRLGGQMNLAALPPGKERFAKVPEYIEKQIRDIGVQVKLNCEADITTIQALHPTVLISATGAEPAIPDIEDLEKTSYHFAGNVLQDLKAAALGVRILILGGGQVGCELAKLLLANHKTVYVVEISDRLAADMEAGSRNVLLEALFSWGDHFQPHTSTEIANISSSSTIQLRSNAQVFEIRDIDTVIIAAGARPCLPFQKDAPLAENIYIIGDANQPRSALEAIHEGYQIGAAI
ncbi:MAG: NAD(P)/FAD-dependent oxidoreductase [Desulfobacteraceae bacterium]|nr:NAD(P)/FAD-dependent oxidoreductase [Desulfobacteraceae bacterium]